MFPALTALLAAIVRPERDIFDGVKQSEDAFHSLWDDIIRNILHVLLRHSTASDLEMTRNRTDVYNSGVLKDLARADFLCYLRQALVLREEEKEDSTVFDAARCELLLFGDWSPMYYGELPFVLGYATELEN